MRSGPWGKRPDLVFPEKLKADGVPNCALKSQQTRNRLSGGLFRVQEQVAMLAGILHVCLVARR
jgi:hypothetical protein